LDRSGSSFQLMRLAWSCGLGATLGNGRQRMPVVALSDWLGAVQWAADIPHAAGAYNVTIPEPTTNAEFTDVLARTLHRPRLLAAPEVVLRTGLGERAGQMVGDIYVVPRRLTEHGFVFGAPDVTSTVAAALHKG
jgi:NAD dependent epimerase/dehydratase family enzyme